MLHRNFYLRQCEVEMTKENIKNFIFIHILFLWYSLVGLFSKNASKYAFLSLDYLKWYGGVLLIMGVYAVLWQQALKRMQLTIAYSNKAIITVWGVLWGLLFWSEKITIGKICGIIIILVGIVLVVQGGKDANNE